ncbi:NAD(P)-dependent oxidoreductase [Bradyrhizobium commune]|uniref:NAD(P)-dependent oxidoreductase n=2 Tax=Bradyrhizobium commune TaxID=83627 RepID=A0A7S9H3R7_9BRAD|nr:NAD(P)-dependent oxidoreductase [Bradyrhizobium commune]
MALGGETPREETSSMPQPKIAFVGFGEAARCFATHLTARIGTPMVAFCQGKINMPPYSEAFRALAAGCGVTLVGRLEDLSEADVIFSAVVVAVAAETGEAISRIVRPGSLVVDINAATPRTKKRVAEAVEARGGVFADANLMGSVDLYGAAVPLYASGSGAARFAEVFEPLGFRIEVAGPEAGTAAAVKMLRSVVTKGMEALLIEALTAATLAGVREETLRGLCASMDATTFSKFLDMCVRSDVLHAERRAVEMDGVAAGLRELGFNPLMTTATTERLRASAQLGLREEFARRSGYSADEVLDRYAHRLSGR